MNKDILTLSTKINKIVKARKKKVLRRPIFIEICGSPKSGKTTHINSLDTFLTRYGLKTKIIFEKATENPIDNKLSPSYNIWNLTGVIQDLLSVIESEPEYDVVIIERGLFDNLIWFEKFFINGSLSKNEHDVLLNFITNKMWISIIDMVIVFYTEPEVSLQREHIIKTNIMPGRIMNLSTLTEYNQAIEVAVNKYGNYFRKIEKFDNSHIDEDDSVYNLIEMILEELNEDIAYIYVR